MRLSPHWEDHKEWADLSTKWEKDNEDLLANFQRLLVPKSENYCMLQSDFDIVNFHILHGMFLEPNLILGELTERFEWRPKNIYLPQG